MPGSRLKQSPKQYLGLNLSSRPPTALRYSAMLGVSGGFCTQIVSRTGACFQYG
ncbi:hypothetical protein GBAR_LOCUS16182 [Geodia barretti]|uniref:Uncharacterized protein n=1 Tax=Geodia barretti TaxID=519541 RepID=A0AA35SE09_GEOBA|nr:hypothetical protein GBAR_LOCUS16182 [Geodia barretti]